MLTSLLALNYLIFCFNQFLIFMSSDLDFHLVLWTLYLVLPLWIWPFLLCFYIFNFNNIFFFPFLPSFLPSFLSFFLLSQVADRVLLLWPGVRPEPLRCESQVQDTRSPETSQPHVILKGKNSPRDLHLKAKTQLHSKTSKLQCWTPHAKQLARQEHNTTH